MTTSPAPGLTLHVIHFARRLSMRPTRKSTLALLAAAVVLFVLSPVGQNGSGPSWIGDIGWYGFMVCTLLLIASGLYAVVSSIRHRSRLSPQ